MRSKGTPQLAGSHQRDGGRDPLAELHLATAHIDEAVGTDGESSPRREGGPRGSGWKSSSKLLRGELADRAQHPRMGAAPAKMGLEGGTDSAVAGMGLLA